MAESNSESSVANGGAGGGGGGAGATGRGHDRDRDKEGSIVQRLLQQLEVEMNVQLMFERAVVTSREVSYQRWMLVHSMMSGCAGLFRQTSCIIQFYK